MSGYTCAWRDSIEKREWQKLFETSIYATPFQSPAWLSCFEADCVFLIAECEGQLRALLPLMRYSDELHFLGEGITDYHDLLGDPAAASVVWKELQHRPERVYLTELAPTSAMLAACNSAVVAPVSVCPVRRLPSTVETFESGLSYNFRQSLRKSWNQLSREGALEMVEGAALLEQLFELHSSKWDAKGGGVLKDEWIRGFHRKFVCRAGAMVRLTGLKYRGDLIAVVYALVRDKRAWLYLSGYEPRFDRFSPGSLAIWQTLRMFIEDGITYVDFLRGAESYKYRWGFRDRTNYAVTLERTH